MLQRSVSPVILTLVLMLAAVVPQQASAPQQPPPAGPPPQGPGGPPPGGPGVGPQGPGGPQRPRAVQTVTVNHVPLELFAVPDGLEVTLWAETPMVRNPTNMDIDRDGRIWVAEGVRYRSHHARQPEGDRILVLEDTDKDGKADKQWTFVQEVDLVAPLGISVIDNKVVVAQPPDLIVYTDVDRNLKFDPAVDKREVLLTGFQGKNHDHSLHSVTVGADGKWYFNSGNTGGMFTDKSGKTFRVFGAYRDGPVGPFKNPHNPAEWAGKPSDDGHTYVGGFTVRMNPDGTNAEIIGHNYRNSYEQSITSLGDVFQNDNDDPPACRVSWVMEYANFGFSSNDGQRTWQADRRPGQSTPVAEWRQDDPGMTPVGDVYGGGSPTGNVFYENGALGAAWEGTFLAAEAGRNEIFSYQPKPAGAGSRSIGRSSSPPTRRRTTPGPTSSAAAAASPARWRRCSGRRTSRSVRTAPSTSPTGSTRASAATRISTTATTGAIYRIAPKGFAPRCRRFDAKTIEGLITALRSPAVNVRAIGFEGLKARGAAAVSPVAALLKDPNRFVRGRALYLLYQLGPEGQKRAGTPESHADPAMRIAAYRAMRRAEPRRAAGRGASSPRTRIRASGARSRCRCATCPPTKALDVLVEIARGYDGKDRSYLEALGTGATGKEAALYDRLRKEPAPRAIRWRGTPTFARIAWRLHVPAAVPDLLARAHVDEAVGRRPPARDGHPGVRQRSGRVEGHADARGAGQRAARAGDVVAAEPHVERLGGARAAAGAEDGRHLRSRRDHAEGSDGAGGRRRICRSCRLTAIARLTGNAAARQGDVGALPDVPSDRRHRRRARPGARRLGPRQVGRGHRHRDGEPERRDRPRLRRHGAPDQRRPDHPGRADQAGRSADDAQHGRRHADHPRRPRRRTPADAGRR